MMQTPYQILGIGSAANDDEIKQAYLQQVKNNPPDRDQEKFQSIHHAYQAIKDEKSRLKYALFTLPNASFNQVLDQALPPVQNLTLTAANLQEILEVSMDETSLLNALIEPSIS